jgi:hypothetical protein
MGLKDNQNEFERIHRAICYEVPHSGTQGVCHLVPKDMVASVGKGVDQNGKKIIALKLRCEWFTKSTLHVDTDVMVIMDDNTQYGMPMFRDPTIEQIYTLISGAIVTSPFCKVRLV